MQTLLRSALALALLAAITSPSAAGEPDPREVQCLAQALFWEAKTEGAEGMVGVASVVLNRVRHREFPDTVCGVVRQGGEEAPCQFSFWCDGKSDRPTDPRLWSLAQQTARQVLRDPPPDPTRGSLFFHAVNINVPWKVTRQRTAIIGRHAYYR